MLAYPIKTRYLTDEQGVPNSVVVELKDWQEIEHLLRISANYPALTQNPRQQTEDERRAAFLHHIGAIDLGHATGTNNEQIDEDLACAYAE